MKETTKHEDDSFSNNEWNYFYVCNYNYLIIQILHSDERTNFSSFSLVLLEICCQFD